MNTKQRIISRAVCEPPPDLRSGRPKASELGHISGMSAREASIDCSKGA